MARVGISQPTRVLEAPSALASHLPQVAPSMRWSYALSLSDIGKFLYNTISSFGSVRTEDTQYLIVWWTMI